VRRANEKDLATLKRLLETDHKPPPTATRCGVPLLGQACDLAFDLAL
jgi:hypothetical protein